MDMKKVGQEMSILMGASMSFVLSLVGTLSSGNFTWQSFLLSFFISFLLSLILGLAIPVRSIVEVAIRRLGLKHGELKARLLESLITDLVYSPIMTFLMVYIAYRQAVSHGARIHFAKMLLKSELTSFIIAFILSFVLSPVFLKLVMKRNGIGKTETPETH